MEKAQRLMEEHDIMTALDNQQFDLAAGAGGLRLAARSAAPTAAPAAGGWQLVATAGAAD